jgi:phospholipase C
MGVLLSLSVMIALALVAIVGRGSTRPASAQTPTPIQHVVVFYQENHSFNNVLGAWCVQTQRCQGSTSGQLSSGQTIGLSATPDVVPNVNHSVKSQTAAIAGGAMNGFDQIKGCAAPTYACYSQFEPTAANNTPNPSIQNVLSLANQFAVSDQTFEPGAIPSWGEHLDLATANQDGFSGNNPKGNGPGWGCDSGDTAQWSKSGTAPWKLVPSCVPAPKGSPEVALEPPAVQTSPVRWVPTIMDELDAAGQSWKIYAASKKQNNYIWAVCPTFADCLYTGQANNMMPTSNIINDAKNGQLPNFSILLPSKGPSGSTSQHNGTSMALGDSWIGQAINALETGPEWSSTAILLTWDDCGCFYDSVPPPPSSNLGIRVPMILISPWVIPGHTDSTVATSASILAFAEHTLGLPPLSTTDQNAYDYFGSFNFGQTAAAIKGHRVTLKVSPEPPSSKAWIKRHPPDTDDPT